MGLQSVSNALQLLLIFQVDVRPQDVLRSLAIELPVALGAMYVLEVERS